jgi:hypothetical protein
MHAYIEQKLEVTMVKTCIKCHRHNILEVLVLLVAPLLCEGFIAQNPTFLYMLSFGITFMMGVTQP